MPRRFARAGFLEDPGMHPAQMNEPLETASGDDETSLTSREGKPMAKKPLIRSCGGGTLLYRPINMAFYQSALLSQRLCLFSLVDG